MSLPHSEHDRAVLRAMVEAAGNVGELLALAERLPRKCRRDYAAARRRYVPPREALLEALQPPKVDVDGLVAEAGARAVARTLRGNPLEGRWGR